MIKKIFSVAILCTITYAQTIHINQIGYYPYNRKVATIEGLSSGTFKICDADGLEHYTGNLTPSVYDSASGQNVCTADFTKLTKPGDYFLILEKDLNSYKFSINSNVNKNALHALLKSYYYQRCGFALESEYAGIWEREAGHVDDAALTIFDDFGGQIYDVSGGWYDAGDFGKYIVCAGITCGTLLQLYELCPGIIGDSELNIPESGNQKSDLLDEVKYELDWFLRMQDTDGGVFFKVGPEEWPWDNWMPADDFNERFIIGKSTTSTLDFTAVMAMAGRIYKQYDSEFAKKCIEKAEAAWKWAKANPEIGHPTVKTGTGPYEDGSDTKYTDEFFWALTELAITTNNSAYKDTLQNILKTRKITGAAWWQDVKDLAFFSLSVNNSLTDTCNEYVKNQITSYADKLLEKINTSPYFCPMRKNNYTWGSNGTCGNMGVILAYAHNITKKKEYMDALVLTTDYVFGRNPMGYCYVTGLGTKASQYPHHRQSNADDIEEAVPGFVVGGANKDTSGADSYTKKVIKSGAAPSMCYTDEFGSSASNENAINQNAPWVLVTGYLETFASQDVDIMHSHRQSTNKRSTTIIAERNGIRITNDSKNELNAVTIYNLQGKCILNRKLNSKDESFYIPSKFLGSGSIIIGLQGKSGTEYRNIHLVN